MEPRDELVDAASHSRTSTASWGVEHHAEVVCTGWGDKTPPITEAPTLITSSPDSSPNNCAVPEKPLFLTTIGRERRALTQSSFSTTR